MLPSSSTSIVRATALASVLAVALAGSASAQAPGGPAYAIVVGSDAGGAGQEPLRYAESDATRVRDALVAVGGYAPSRVTLLRSPEVADLERAFATLHARLAEHRRRDEPTRLVFYYSGHARAESLSLGGEELALARLRAWIEGAGADLALVLLDACQSGAYARVRGAAPAADFSYNSVDSLRTRGIAILASSSDDELSQESETLRGGFFTHHFVVGMRGAADVDGDGRVTLDEVYRYAYARTLADTSRTTVGGQHVSLETELSGHGGVLVGYPARADAHLAFQARLAGTVLVQHLRSGSVLAELEKASGSAVRLALPEGRYLVVVRGQRTLHECTVTLRDGAVETIELSRCTERPPVRDVRPRGEGDGPLRARLGFEVGAGALGIPRDDFADRLEEFGFDDFDSRVVGHGSFALEARLPRRMSLVVRARTLGHAYYSRSGNDSPYIPEDRFRFTSFALGVGLRGTSLFDEGRVALYGEAGVGLGAAVSRFETDGLPSDVEAHFGYTLEASGGLRFMPWERFGFFFELAVQHAPIVRNRIGEVYDVARGSFLFGLRAEVRE